MDQPFYASTAYNPASIPDQPPSVERSWIKRFAKVRLPWGNTQDVAPERIFCDPTPSSLRFWETVEKERLEQKAQGTYVPPLFEGMDLHQKYDHEYFRYALLSNRSHFWMILLGGGRFLFFFLLIISLITYLLVITASDDPWQELTYELIPIASTAVGVPLFCWALGSLVIRYFPRLWFKPSRGPLWEFNRRTGLVTVFDYDNNGEYKKNGTIGEITAPFYEFDAYIATSPDRQGLPMNVLYLAHRYRDIIINFGYLVAPDRSPQLPCALWDFFQNFMDTSRPLPDLPCYEQYRHLDPVTAEHDRRTGRDPRYWIDMDDETFKGKVKDMLRRIDAIDTMSRFNLMVRHVHYTD
ncbi:hypothetical protein [Pseudomonas indica]|uniref:hypothetical protein n=1 Tax=Pseudomonas indica TaxID=137658 RepID=UPI003FD1231F